MASPDSDKTPSLVDVGEHECVTCTRCATTFAKVHPACPSCAAEAEVVRLREALQRLGSNASFTTALDLRHSTQKAIIDELKARMEYARAAVASLDKPPDHEYEVAKQKQEDKRHPHPHPPHQGDSPT